MAVEFEVKPEPTSAATYACSADAEARATARRTARKTMTRLEEAAWLKQKIADGMFDDDDSEDETEPEPAPLPPQPSDWPGWMGAEYEEDDEAA